MAGGANYLINEQTRAWSLTNHAFKMAVNPMVKLNDYCTKKGLRMKEESESTGPPHAKSFVCHLTVGEYFGKGEGKTKKLAKADAARDMVQKIESSESAVVAPLDVSPSPRQPDGPNFKVTLQEYCQKNGFSIPQYPIIRKSGPAHQLEFEIRCSVYRKATELIAEQTGVGNSKKTAEIEAAKKAYEFLTTENRNHEIIRQVEWEGVMDVDSPVPSPASPTSPQIEVNVKGKLQELCQRNHLQIPKYTRIGQVGPSHASNFTVKCLIKDINGAVIEDDYGYGKSLKSAETDAATKLLAKLQKLIDSASQEGGWSRGGVPVFPTKSSQLPQSSSPVEELDMDELVAHLILTGCSGPEYLVETTEPLNNDPATVEYLCLAYCNAGPGSVAKNCNYDVATQPIVGHGRAPLEDDAKRDALANLIHNIHELGIANSS